VGDEFVSQALQWAPVVVGVLGALLATYVRLVKLEHALERSNEARVAQEKEQQMLSDRLSAIERDRAMLERVHKIETHLASISARLRSIEENMRESSAE
jgi:hypothetical protein